MSNESLNETQLLVTAADLLQSAGYTEVRSDRIGMLAARNCRVYEDEYSIVCVAVLPTWSELARSWTDLQAIFAELLSDYLKRTDAKSWDGYLVLITPGVALESWGEVEQIRRDTTRLRKLVGTGDDLKSYADVETLLSPLLPIHSGGTISDNSGRDVWSMVKRVLGSRQVAGEVVDTVIDAHEEQRNLMEAIRSTIQR